MADSLVSPNGASMEGHAHEFQNHSHGHSHGHSRSQHRKAAPVRAAQGSIGGFEEEGHTASGDFGSKGGHFHGQQNHPRALHRNTPSFQLNGSFSGFPESSRTLEGFANSPQPDNSTFDSEPASQVRLGNLSHNHTHSHAHSPSYSQTHLSDHDHDHGHDHSHDHNHSHSHSLDGTMATSEGLRHMVGDESSALGRDLLTRDEALAALLIPLPLAMVTWLKSAYNSGGSSDDVATSPWSLSLFHILLFSSLILIVIGAYGKVSATAKTTSLSKGRSPGLTLALISQPEHLSAFTKRLMSVALPMCAVAQLGTTTTCAFILTAIITRVLPAGPAGQFRRRVTVLSKLARANIFAMSALVLHILAGILGFSSSTSLASLTMGYLSTALSVLIVPIPFKSDTLENRGSASGKQSPLIATPLDIDLTCAAGSLAFILSAFVYLILPNGSQPIFSVTNGGAGIIAITAALALILPNPARLVSRYKAGFAFSLCLPALFEVYYNRPSILSMATQGFLLALTWASVSLDAYFQPDSKQFHRRRGNSIRPSTNHSHAPGPKQYSWLTNYILAHTANWQVLHSILSEDDSRPVFYFMLLNLAFMCVQAFYSVATGSLGLLSDSIHMFFDCFALALGLAAAVMSKWPPSVRFPYGLGMLNTLAGFGNGIFLMLISVEIIYEAMERIAEGLEMNRLKELFIVSVLGMLVNLVGLFAVGHEHHHHGHSHGHSHGHGHDHGHSHSHSHSHNHNHSHAHDHGHAHSHNHSYQENEHSHRHSPSADSNGLSTFRPVPSPLGARDPNTLDSRANPLHEHAHSHSDHAHARTPAASSKSGHAHDHGNENMIGIYLHIMADALGSLAVIVSTVLIKYTGKTWWDPVASIIIAVLIFASAIPLVQSCAKRLLLTNPASLEFDLKEAIQIVSGLRGVSGVCVPRFWSVELGEGEEKVHGVIHIIASAREPLEDVRKRAETELAGRGFQVVVQVERESEGRCWCGGGKLRV